MVESETVRKTRVPRVSPSRMFSWMATLGVISSLVLGGPLLGGTVTGTVKNSVSNAVISGVTVKVNEQSGKQATTNSSGVFSIASVAAGTVTLNASKTGFVTQNTGSLTVTSSGTVTAPTTLLVPNGTISGKIVNAVGGAAISSATITVTGTGTSTTSNSSGTFSLSLAPGTVTLTITKSGYLTTTSPSYGVTAGGTIATGSLAISQGAVSGAVKDALTSAAVAGATVLVTGTTSQATTNASGVFTVPSNSGSVTLTVSATGYLTKTTSAISVTAGQTANAGTVNLTAGGTVTGTIVNALGGAAISGATVTVTGTSTSATSNSSGAFSVTAAAGSVTLTITKSGYLTATSPSLTVTAGGTTNAGSLAISQGAVSGTVKDAATSVAIAGATVLVTGTSSQVTTNSGGAFSVPSNAGTVTLTVSAVGWLTKKTSSITVTAGQTASAGTITLTAAGIITGIVVAGTPAAPLAGATVKVTGTSNSTTTDAAGTFTLSQAAGSVTLTVSKTGFVTATTAALTVTVGTTTDAGTIALVSPASVIGAVRTAMGGGALAGVTVKIANSTTTATTAADGSFSLTPVTPGIVYLTLSLAGFPSASPWVIAYSGMTTDIGTVLMSSTAIPEQPSLPWVTGLVVNDADGTPVSGAYIFTTGGPLPPRSTQADASGRFTLGVGADAVGVFACDAPRSACSTVAGPFIVNQGQVVDAGTLRMKPSGTLTGSTSGIGGVRDLPPVALCVTGTLQCVALAYDQTFSGLPAFPGPASVTVTYPSGRSITNPTVNVTAGQVTNLGIVDASTRAVITASVLAEGSLAGVSNPTATLSNSSLRAGKSGSTVLFGDPVPGTYAITAQAPGWLANTGAAFTVIDVIPNTNAGTVILAQGGRAAGTARESGTGRPIAGVDVIPVGGGQAGLTDAFGNFEITLAPGPTTLLLQKTGWISHTLPPANIEVGTTLTAGIVELVREPSSSVTLRGIVLGGTQPLVGASVLAVEQGVSTVTDASGAFSLTVQPGRTSLAASAGGWAVSATPPVDYDAATTVTDIRLTLTQPLVTISGTVTNAFGGSPVSGATVTLRAVGSVALTDSLGRFSISSPVGDQFLEVTKSGWYDGRFYGGPGVAATSFGTLRLNAGQTVTGLRLVMAPVSTITGRVVRSSDGSPLPGAIVSAAFEEVHADAAGRFSLPTTDSFGQLGVGCWSCDGLSAPVTVGLAESVDAGDLSMTGIGWIAARLVNGTPPATVTGYTITVTGPGGPVSLQNGGYPPGTYMVTLAAQGHDTKTIPNVVVRQGEVTNLGGVPTVGYGTWAGHVVDDTDDTRLAGVTVSITDTGKSTVTDATGQFSLTEVEGCHTYSFAKYGYATRSYPDFCILAGNPPWDIFPIRLVPAASLTLADVYVIPNPVVGGQTATGTVALSMPAPGSGVSITLLSSNAALARVPASVLVPGGALTDLVPEK